MKGIDVPISKQVNIFEEMWRGKNTVVYGRVFRNERDGQEIPEALSGSEYSEVLIDDTKDGICFFDVRPARIFIGGNYQADVDIYFAVNLDKLYPDVTERATEYLLDDVLSNLFKFQVITITTGKEAFAGWGAKPEDNMQPFFLVRIETIIDYKQTC